MGVSVWTGQHVAGGAGAGDRPGRSGGRQDGQRHTELGLRSKGGVTPEDPESEERPVPFVGGEPLREAFPATKPRPSWRRGNRAERWEEAGERAAPFLQRPPLSLQFSFGLKLLPES